jgi:hypothetical protein
MVYVKLNSSPELQFEDAAKASVGVGMGMVQAPGSHPCGRGEKVVSLDIRCRVLVTPMRAGRERRTGTCAGSSLRHTHAGGERKEDGNRNNVTDSVTPMRAGRERRMETVTM